MQAINISVDFSETREMRSSLRKYRPIVVILLATILMVVLTYGVLEIGSLDTIVNKRTTLPVMVTVPVTRREGTDEKPEHQFDEGVLREVRQLEGGEWKIVFSRINPQSVGTVHHLDANNAVPRDTAAGLQVVPLHPEQRAGPQALTRMTDEEQKAENREVEFGVEQKTGYGEEQRADYDEEQRADYDEEQRAVDNRQGREILEEVELTVSDKSEDNALRMDKSRQQLDPQVPALNKHPDVPAEIPQLRTETPPLKVTPTGVMPRSIRQAMQPRDHWRKHLENLKFSAQKSMRSSYTQPQKQQRARESEPKSHDQAQYHKDQQYDRPDFSIKPYFSFPLSQYTNPMATVLQSEWVHSLQEYLITLGTSSKQVSIVTANWEHEVVLLNWLISAFLVARPPVENVLVLSLSRKLYELLKSKNIPVIFIDPPAIIGSSAAHIIRTAFTQVHIVRLSLFRLLNHWGYDVVMYDSDAIPLKNPQPLFDKYPEASLIGSAGRGPENIMAVWGRTICTGVLLLRSSSVMGKEFLILSRIVEPVYTC